MNLCQSTALNHNFYSTWPLYPSRTQAPELVNLHTLQQHQHHSSSLPDSTSAPPTTASVAMVTCDVQAIRSAQSSVVTQNIVLTVLVLTLFVVSKSYFNRVRRRMARCTVFVIGAGPTGLTSALLACQSPHVSRVVVYEEMPRADLLQKGHQVEFNRKSRDFLSNLGVDFDGLEGCLVGDLFHTRVGVFLEHVLHLLTRGPVSVTLKLGVKFNKERVS
ncbi:uncharacterized protein LOC101846292, partial [Aplysia californica]|uniref:Uncharacterized protein LOC101846292 n=1 Tax=Aplysia californica TaxID=6500 RepID=A0ABM1VVD6_APLCA